MEFIHSIILPSFLLKISVFQSPVCFVKQKHISLLAFCEIINLPLHEFLKLEALYLSVFSFFNKKYYYQNNDLIILMYPNMLKVVKLLRKLLCFVMAETDEIGSVFISFFLYVFQNL